MTPGYYSGVNPDLLAWVPQNAQAILEVGCGNGNLGQVVRSRNPEVRYVGIEYVAQAASTAAQVLSEVLMGDLEQPAVLEALEAKGKNFDTLIFGDVLEHLRDPARVLQNLRAHTVPGAVCVVSVPNVSHWSLLQQQLRGRWDYADAGLLDRTHLRFFTLETLLEMLRAAGWTVVDVKPRVVSPQATKNAVEQFLPLAPALGRSPDLMRRDLSAFQWVVRAVNGPAPAPLRVAALALNKVAGVNEARIDHPLTALATRPGVTTAWGEGRLSLSSDARPGVLILHRALLTDERQWQQFQSLVARGWVLVSELDDDPDRWPAFAANNYRAFRGVHAVSVSTEPLAQKLSQWNPHVRVFPNAIFALPNQGVGGHKQTGEVPRIFFGALNRAADWQKVGEGIAAAARTLGRGVQWVVVHDRGFFEALPDNCDKVFHPTLPLARYAEVMAGCDIALLPLEDTPFNRLKSDLKLIECAASGVVPICSPVIYAANPAHADVAVFATSSEQWRGAIVNLCHNPQLRARYRERGIEYVRTARMHSKQVAGREAWYRSLVENRHALEQERQARLTLLPA